MSVGEKSCRQNTRVASNYLSAKCLLPKMTRSSFWEFRLNIFLGKTFKNTRRIYFEILQLEKTRSLAIGLSVFEVLAHSVQK